MNHEDDIIKKRFLDLANKSYNRDICTFTNFLGLSDIDLFYQMKSDLSFVDSALFGGAEYSERKILRFGNNETPFPISCIQIAPVQKKFADELTHRDFLGALINLGIKRETLGDILIYDKEAYLFCLNSIDSFIIDNLDRVKHTVVKCKLACEIPHEVLNHLEDKEINVASLRLDAIIGEVFKLSRNQSQLLIREKRIFVNGRIYENNSYMLKPNDIISVRGMGKFIFGDTVRNTKKGRCFVTVSIFR